MTSLGKIEGVNDVREESLPDNIFTYTIDAENNTGVRPKIAQTVMNSGLELLQLKDLTLTLEDIFINVTMK